MDEIDLDSSSVVPKLESKELVAKVKTVINALAEDGFLEEHEHQALRQLITDYQSLKSALDQVDDELVCSWIVAKDNDYRKALHDLISWNIQVANDPQVSEDAVRRIQEIHNAALKQAISIVGDTVLYCTDPEDRKEIYNALDKMEALKKHGT